MSLNEPEAERNLRYGIIILIGLLWAGCASVKVQTSGESQHLRWQATDFQHYTVAIEDREIYKYTLVLEELQGRDVTFTHLKAKLRNNEHSRRVDWEKAGTWTLPANGELRIPLGTFRHCRVPNCEDWGQLAPVWDLTLSGTDSYGQPVQEVIRLRLPYINETA